MLTTLCAGYVTTELRNVQQPCRDMMAHMVLAGVLRVGPTLSKARQNRVLLCALCSFVHRNVFALMSMYHASNVPSLWDTIYPLLR